MHINNHVTVTQDEVNTVEHSQNIMSVSTPDRPPRKPRVKRSDTRSTWNNVNTLDNYDETLTFPIHEHLQLHASQYKQKTQHP